MPKGSSRRTARASDAAPGLTKAEQIEAMAARPAPAAPPVGRWGRDLLGADYQAQTFRQPDDDEGAVVTTVIRYRPGGAPLPRRPRFAVLYVHGWSDYFIQTELAQFWHERGAVFYAIDLRKSGRSIRPHQTPCFVESLREYDADLALVIDLIRRNHGADVPLVAVGHSQGGLTTALWASRHRGMFAGLALNAPFLEMHGSSFARAVSQPLVQQVAKLQSRMPLPISGPGFYDRTIRAELEGEWTLEPAWRPVTTHPLRPGWINAVMEGHAIVADGLDLDIPILVMTSSKTSIGARWRDTMRTSDAVLDVKQLWRRMPDLGDVVTLVKVRDGLHDVLLSPHPVRDRAYDALGQWFRGFVEPHLPAAPAGPTDSIATL